MDDLDKYRDADGYIRLRRKDSYIALEPKSPGIKAKFSRTETEEIVLRHGHIAITNFKMTDNPEFIKALSVWDKIKFQYRFVGGYYIKELKELRVNRAFDLRKLRSFFPNRPFRVENDPYPTKPASLKLYTPPITDFQKVALTFMVGEGEYFGNRKYTQQMITAEPGAGKSYLGISTSVFLDARTVIFVPFGKLVSQWKESYLKFTSIKESEILLVRSKHCHKIIDGKYKHIKIFIITTDTAASIVKQFGNLTAIDMFAAMNARMKITDEVHRDLKIGAMIEALCNYRMNYYLSASPGRTEQKEDWMFSILYSNMPKFGEGFETEDEKHINIMVKKYVFTPTPQQINKIVNRKTGMNTLTYEKVFCESPDEVRQSFDSSLRVMLNWSKNIIAKENKILILAKTITFIEYIQAIAEEVFPGKTALYHGQLKSAEKEAALKAKVIVATTSSLGTGADIPGLQHCYNCGTYSGKIEAIQTCGRLRKLKDPTQQSVYIELVNYGWRKTFLQYDKRKPYLIKRSKSGKLIVIN